MEFTLLWAVFPDLNGCFGSLNCHRERPGGVCVRGDETLPKGDFLGSGSMSKLGVQ